MSESVHGLKRLGFGETNCSLSAFNRSAILDWQRGIAIIVKESDVWHRIRNTNRDRWQRRVILVVNSCLRRLWKSSPEKKRRPTRLSKETAIAESLHVFALSDLESRLVSPKTIIFFEFIIKFITEFDNFFERKIFESLKLISIYWIDFYLEIQLNLFISLDISRIIWEKALNSLQILPQKRGRNRTEFFKHFFLVFDITFISEDR